MATTIVENLEILYSSDYPLLMTAVFLANGEIDRVVACEKEKLERMKLVDENGEMTGPVAMVVLDHTQKTKDQGFVVV